MIIWINGAWGAGKTTTAVELNRRLSNSIIYDPEEVGFFINKVLPEELHQPDFQMFKQWRTINVEMLKKLDKDFSGTIIIPMTLIHQEYVDEIIGELKVSGIEVNHYILSTSSEVLNKRLTHRFERKNSWARQRVEIAIESLKKIKDARKIQTDYLSIEEVVDWIASDSHLTLLPDKRSLLRRKIDRVLLSIKEKIN